MPQGSCLDSLFSDQCKQSPIGSPYRQCDCSTVTLIMAMQLGNLKLWPPLRISMYLQFFLVIVHSQQL